MRQLVAFLDKISTRRMKDEYYRTKHYAEIHGVQVKPLEEIVGDSGAGFDQKTDAELDKRMKLRLEQQQKEAAILNGRAIN